jgi:hypothetical protein
MASCTWLGLTASAAVEDCRYHFLRNLAPLDEDLEKEVLAQATLFELKRFIERADIQNLYPNLLWTALRRHALRSMSTYAFHARRAIAHRCSDAT